MAGGLINTWNLHAFPDEFSSREEAWTAESERRVQETRLENFLEASGSDLRIRRFSTGKDSRQDKIDAARKRDIDDLVRLAVGSPAYMEAYNNKLTFQIGGEDFEITQGELYERAKTRAEDLRKQIDAARRRGASAEEIAMLTDELDRTEFVEQKTNPERGKLSEEDHLAVQGVLQVTPALTKPTNAEARFGRDQENQLTQGEDMSASISQDTATEAAWMQWSGATERASVAYYAEVLGQTIAGQYK